MALQNGFIYQKNPTDRSREAVSLVSPDHFAKKKILEAGAPFNQKSVDVANRVFNNVQKGMTNTPAVPQNGLIKQKKMTQSPNEREYSINSKEQGNEKQQSEVDVVFNDKALDQFKNPGGPVGEGKYFHDILAVLSNPPNIFINFNNKKIADKMNIKSQYDEIINQDDIPYMIKQYGEIGLKNLECQNYREAISSFRRAEIIFDKYIENDGKVSNDLILHIILNLGISFYRVGLFDEAFSCFENSELRLVSQYKIKKALKQGVVSDSSQNLLDNYYFVVLANKMKKKRLRLELCLQNCILFSEIGQHVDAVRYSALANKIINQILYDTLIICYYQLQNFIKSNQRPQTSGTKRAFSSNYNSAGSASNSDSKNPSIQNSPQKLLNILDASKAQWEKLHDLDSNINKNKFPKESGLYSTQDQAMRFSASKQEELIAMSEEISYIFQLIPILEVILKVVQDNPKKEFLNQKREKILEQVKSACLQMIDIDYEPNLEFLHREISPEHWILENNILALLQIKPLNLSEITQIPDLRSEISVNMILKKISWLAISCYCMSTEIRFHQNLNPLNQIADISESEFWLGKSLQIAYVLLPHQAPIMTQIINVNNKFHGIQKQIILEDQQNTTTVKVLKTLPGSISAIKLSFFIPTIRVQLKGIQKYRESESNENLQSNKTGKNKTSTNQDGGNSTQENKEKPYSKIEQLYQKLESMKNTQDARSNSSTVSPGYQGSITNSNSNSETSTNQNSVGETSTNIPTVLSPSFKINQPPLAETQQSLINKQKKSVPKVNGDLFAQQQETNSNNKQNQRKLNTEPSSNITRGSSANSGTAQSSSSTSSSTTIPQSNSNQFIIKKISSNQESVTNNNLIINHPNLILQSIRSPSIPDQRPSGSAGEDQMGLGSQLSAQNNYKTRSSSEYRQKRNMSEPFKPESNFLSQNQIQSQPMAPHVNKYILNNNLINCDPIEITIKSTNNTNSSANGGTNRLNINNLLPLNMNNAIRSGSKNNSEYNTINGNFEDLNFNLNSSNIKIPDESAQRKSATDELKRKIKMKQTALDTRKISLGDEQQSINKVRELTLANLTSQSQSEQKPDIYPYNNSFHTQKEKIPSLYQNKISPQEDSNLNLINLMSHSNSEIKDKQQINNRYRSKSLIQRRPSPSAQVITSSNFGGNNSNSNSNSQQYKNILPPAFSRANQRFLENHSDIQSASKDEQNLQIGTNNTNQIKPLSTQGVVLVQYSKDQIIINAGNQKESYNGSSNNEQQLLNGTPIKLSLDGGFKENINF